jgi:hypothetical protein
LYFSNVLLANVSYHKSGFSNWRLRVRNSKENGNSGLDLVHVGHAGSIKFWDSGSIVQVDQEAVDPAVVGVDGDVATEVFAAGAAFALKYVKVIISN